MLSLTVLLSLICSVLAQGNVATSKSCVIMKDQDRCKASELVAGVNVVSFKQGSNKCNSVEECCARKNEPFGDIALKAGRKCRSNCNTVCKDMGKNSNLYSATWPKKCLASCKTLQSGLYYGLFGAECPIEDSCLKDNYTMDLDAEDVPEAEECTRDSTTCSECLLAKTLPDYTRQVTSCQSRCTELKAVKFGKVTLSAKMICTTHLYGQYIKFIQDTCSPPEKDQCTPRGDIEISGGACISPNCQKEKEKCLEESASVVQDATEVVHSKWVSSCEETCESETTALAECLKRAEDIRDEFENDMLRKMCSFLDSFV